MSYLDAPVATQITHIPEVALPIRWTNAGKISADLEILQHRSELGEETAKGTVAQGDIVPVVLSVRTTPLICGCHASVMNRILTLEAGSLDGYAAARWRSG